MINEIFLNNSTSFDKYFLKWISVFSLSIVAAVEGLLSAVNDTIIFLIPTIVIVIVDMITAINLNGRVSKKYPNLVEFTGRKFKSKPGLKAVMKIVKMFGGLVIGSFVDQLDMFPDNSGVHTVFIGFLITQLWSILENTSSENDAPWAKIAQIVVIDKASRHLNLDRSELEKHLIKEDENKIQNNSECIDNINNNGIIEDCINTERDDTKINNSSKSKVRQHRINARSIKWNDERKYDINKYREILQELEGQFGNKSK